MPQAKLPDINAAIVTHRGVMLSAYSKRDYVKVITSFRAIISLMPEEYRLNINSARYHDEVKSKTFIACAFCDQKEIPFTQISIFDKLNDYLQELITNEKYSKHWVCPHCKLSNNLVSSSTLLELPEDPIYFKIIPEPPIYINTFSRLRYDNMFDRWFEISLPELEHQIALFRTQYVSETEKDDGDFDDESGDFDDE